GEDIEERGLADARGSEEHRGPARSAVRVEDREPLAGARADRVRRGAGYDVADGRQGRVETRAKIGFAEQQDGLGAALVCDRDVALDLPEVWVAVQRRDDVDDVDVRGR